MKKGTKQNQRSFRPVGCRSSWRVDVSRYYVAVHGHREGTKRSGGVGGRRNRRASADAFVALQCLELIVSRPGWGVQLVLVACLDRGTLSIFLNQVFLGPPPPRL